MGSPGDREVPARRPPPWPRRCFPARRRREFRSARRGARAAAEKPSRSAVMAHGAQNQILIGIAGKLGRAAHAAASRQRARLRAWRARWPARSDTFRAPAPGNRIPRPDSRSRPERALQTKFCREALIGLDESRRRLSAARTVRSGLPRRRGSTISIVAAPTSSGSRTLLAATRSRSIPKSAANRLRSPCRLNRSTERAAMIAGSRSPDLSARGRSAPQSPFFAARIFPAATSFLIPATVVAEAGSQPMPSRPIMALASAISCSLTVITCPPERNTARRAFLPRNRRADFDRRRQRVRIFHRRHGVRQMLAARRLLGVERREKARNRRRAFRLNHAQLRQAVDQSQIEHLLKSLAERRAVAHVSAGNHHMVRAPASGTAASARTRQSSGPSMRNGLIEFAT